MDGMGLDLRAGDRYRAPSGANEKRYEGSPEQVYTQSSCVHVAQVGHRAQPQMPYHLSHWPLSNLFGQQMALFVSECLSRMCQLS